jgi:hyaluronan synthase
LTLEPVKNKNKPDEEKLQQLQKFALSKTGQAVSTNGRVITHRNGWFVRIATLVGMIAVASYNIYVGLMLQDMLVVYATLVLVHSILILSVGWFFYKNPARGKA